MMLIEVWHLIVVTMAWVFYLVAAANVYKQLMPELHLAYDRGMYPSHLLVKALATWVALVVVFNILVRLTSV